MLGERITCGEKRKGINTDVTEDAANTEKKKSCCLTIGEGGNKLSACGNSWSDCFKLIF